MEQTTIESLPHSIEAERSVLGAMLLDAGALDSMLEQLKSDDFWVRGSPGPAAARASQATITTGQTGHFVKATRCHPEPDTETTLAAQTA